MPNSPRSQPIAEICTVGDELLRGTITDRNTPYLAAELQRLGFTVAAAHTLPDDLKVLEQAFRQILSHCELLVVTGGLGPTIDDLTRTALSLATNTALVEEPSVLESIQQRFAQRGIPMPEDNRVQALVPTRGRYYPNPNGTAPGLRFEVDGHVAVAFPGPPMELVPMWEDQVRPELVARWPQAQALPEVLFRLTGIPESLANQELVEVLGPLAEQLRICLLAKPNFVDVRLAGAEAARLAEAEQRLSKHWQEHLYARTEKPLAEVLGEELRRRKWKLAVAESCTGGMVGAAITAVAGSSDYFVGGVVAYANAVKIQAVQVQEATLRRHGAVSAAVAKELARGARNVMGADVGLGITGIAGPGGGTPRKPVGLVYLGVSTPDREEVQEYRFLGSRQLIREWATHKALEMLWKAVIGR